jgi:histidinol-phosphate aminotransferase
VPNSGVQSLAPFQQGKSALGHCTSPIKLSANESRLGPSPAAVDAWQAVGASLGQYPDGTQSELRNAIASTFGLVADQILCGNGSDELLSLLIRAYVAPGDEVVFSRYSFAMAMVHATGQGAKVVIADEPDWRPDADQMLAAVTKRTRMVFLASPNNPVGQTITRADLWRLYRGLPPDVVLVIDSAYADYVTAEDYEPGAALVDAGRNAVMTRTFSKLYGLAGARIGWCYAPPNIIDAVQRIRTPFNASAGAMAAATAAVRDTNYAAYVRDYNERELRRIAAQIAAGPPGMECVPSRANFYLVKFVDGRHTPAGAARALEQHGIIPRPVGAGGPENCLRITVGLVSDNDAVLRVLTNYLRGEA